MKSKPKSTTAQRASFAREGVQTHPSAPRGWFEGTLYPTPTTFCPNTQTHLHTNIYHPFPHETHNNRCSYHPDTACPSSARRTIKGCQSRTTEVPSTRSTLCGSSLSRPPSGHSLGHTATQPSRSGALGIAASWLGR